MTIQVHVACDDENYRSVIADFLGHQTDMEVVGASGSGGIAAAAVLVADADVVVLGIPSTGSVSQLAARYRQMMDEGPVVVAFCMTHEQAGQYRELGIERVILSDEPARELTAAVRSAYAAGAVHVRPPLSQRRLPSARAH
jgi:DNA-binding NarL/FixJ family response regulator